MRGHAKRYEQTKKKKTQTSQNCEPVLQNEAFFQIFFLSNQGCGVKQFTVF